MRVILVDELSRAQHKATKRGRYGVYESEILIKTTTTTGIINLNVQDSNIYLVMCKTAFKAGTADLLS